MTTTVQRDVHKIDAAGKRLGRLATHIATLLRGKHKPTFTPHVDGGDVVEVYNTDKIVLTGAKWDNKIYYRHSGYPGGLTERSAREMHEKDPTFLVYNAVRGMLPDNKLRKPMLRRLRLFAFSQEERSKQDAEQHKAAQEKQDTSNKKQETNKQQ